MENIEEKGLSRETLEYIAKAYKYSAVMVFNDKVYVSDLAQTLLDTQKELEEAKRDSVWWDAPDNTEAAHVIHYISNSTDTHVVSYHRFPSKTPKQELIDKFAEKNALAMKCANLSKEILEAFYEEVKK